LLGNAKAKGSEVLIAAVVNPNIVKHITNKIINGT
jgi:hypothetical protein